MGKNICMNRKSKSTQGWVSEKDGFEPTSWFALLSPGKHGIISGPNSAETIEIAHVFPSRAACRPAAPDGHLCIETLRIWPLPKFSDVAAQWQTERALDRAETRRRKSSPASPKRRLCEIKTDLTPGNTGFFPDGTERAGISRGWWRTVRDSNPRDGSPPTHFPGVRLRPLGQLSVLGCLACP